MRTLDLTGQKFNHLSVLWLAGRDIVGATIRLFWSCQCDCGNIVIRTAARLRSKPTPCDDCANSPQTVEHRAYIDAKRRCESIVDVSYRNYGGRGIKFLFTSFKEFILEIGLKPTPQHTLERIRNNGNYESGNVCWATRKEQAANRRPPRRF